MINLGDIIKASEGRFIAFEIEFADKLSLSLKKKLGQAPTSVSIRLNWDNPVQSVENGVITLNFSGVLFSQSKDWDSKDWSSAITEIAEQNGLKIQITADEGYPVKFSLAYPAVKY